MEQRSPLVIRRLKGQRRISNGRGAQLVKDAKGNWKQINKAEEGGGASNTIRFLDENDEVINVEIKDKT